MQPGAVGWRSAIRVRALHARVRRRLLSPAATAEAWRTAEWGVPINQEDMAAVLLAFSYNVIVGLDGLGDAWGEDQVPFYLAKFAFPMMKLPGWVGLDKEALYIRHRPYAQALRANWRALKTQGFRGGQGNDRSLVWTPA